MKFRTGNLCLLKYSNMWLSLSVLASSSGVPRVCGFSMICLVLWQVVDRMRSQCSWISSPYPIYGSTRWWIAVPPRRSPSRLWVWKRKCDTVECLSHEPNAFLSLGAFYHLGQRRHPFHSETHKSVLTLTQLRFMKGRQRCPGCKIDKDSRGYRLLANTNEVQIFAKASLNAYFAWLLPRCNLARLWLFVGFEWLL